MINKIIIKKDLIVDIKLCNFRKVDSIIYKKYSLFGYTLLEGYIINEPFLRDKIYSEKEILAIYTEESFFIKDNQIYELPCIKIRYSDGNSSIMYYNSYEELHQYYLDHLFSNLKNLDMLIIKSTRNG